MDDLERLEFPKIRALVARFAASALGRSVAEEVRPYADAARANTALEETAEMIAMCAGEGPPSTGGFHDVRPHFDHLHEHGRALEPEELLEVRDVLEAGHRLRRSFEGERRTAFPRLADQAAAIGDFRPLVERLEAALDRRGVRDEASPALAKTRESIRSLSASLRDRVEALARSSRLRSVLSETRPVLRGGRYLLAVKADAMGRVPGLLHGRSNSGHTAFIEPEALVATGNELEDLRSRESREVQRILGALCRAVLDEEAPIRAALARIAWIDFTLAKARIAGAFRFEVPRVEGDELKLVDARHPLLLEQAGDHGAVEWLPPPPPEPRFTVVPLSVRVGDPHRLLVITGPNTGGKTLVIKTIGLVATMARAGLPVPAAAASRIPAYRAVMADIGDEQSIEQSLSTFSSHVRRIVEMLGRADARTLVLLDELGSGTDPAEGAALGRAVMQALVDRGTCGVVTTHLGDLKAFAYEATGVENASVEFDPETLAPTYRLRVGTPGNSNALTIARRLGMDAAIVDRAEQLLAQRDRRAETMIEQVQASRIEAERRREASEALLEEASRIREASAADARAVDERRDELESFADRSVEAQLKAALAHVGPLLAKLKNVPKPHDEDVARLRDALDETLRLTSLGRRRERYLETLRKDDRLVVPRLGIDGRVARVDRKRRLVKVVAGDLRMDVPFEDILPPDQPSATDG